MNQLADTEYSAYVGIDWASAKHDICVQAADGGRRDLIMNVVNTDGGGHVDPTLDEAYLDLSRNNSLGWILEKGDVQEPFPPPVMACIRQVAHEVLETLKKKCSQQVIVDYPA